MTWFCLALSEEQREVVELVESALAALPAAESEDADAALAAHRTLVEAGIWSIGIDDRSGGGGAPLELRLAAFIALGAERPASAWASAQAHAAAEVLAAAGSPLLAAIVEGERPACVVERGDPHVRVAVAGTELSGTIDRVDPGGADPVVVILDGASSAWIVDPSAVSASRPLDRTGLAGASTAAIEISSSTAARVDDLDLDAIRARLWLAGAAIAAGLALAAARRSIDYSQSRVQFGAPLTALPTVRASLQEQEADAVASASAVLSSPAEVEFARAAAVLRENCERAIAVSAAAVQSHGGYGYLKEYGVERIVRDAVSLRAATDAAGAARRAADRLAPTDNPSTRGGR